MSDCVSVGCTARFQPGSSRAFWAVAIAALHAFILTSCSAPGDILTQETSEGIPVYASAGDSGQRVILVLDPAQCFSCNNALPAWLNWGSVSGRTTVLLLTRQPNDLERRKMRLVGLREDGVLRRPVRSGTPIRILLSNSQPPRIAYQATEDDAFRLIAEITGGR